MSNSIKKRTYHTSYNQLAETKKTEYTVRAEEMFHTIPVLRRHQIAFNFTSIIYFVGVSCRIIVTKIVVAMDKGDD